MSKQPKRLQENSDSKFWITNCIRLKAYKTTHTFMTNIFFNFIRRLYSH
jgi:hypothetical protein